MRPKNYVLTGQGFVLLGDVLFIFPVSFLPIELPREIVVPGGGAY